LQTFQGYCVNLLADVRKKYREMTSDMHW